MQQIQISHLLLNLGSVGKIRRLYLHVKAHITVNVPETSNKGTP